MPKESGRCAVTTLQPVYNERPDYLGGLVPPLLYDAYIGRGDAYNEADDCTLAYEQYRQALTLPVADTTAAICTLGAGDRLPDTHTDDHADSAADGDAPTRSNSNANGHSAAAEALPQQNRLQV